MKYHFEFLPNPMFWYKKWFNILKKNICVESRIVQLLIKAVHWPSNTFLQNSTLLHAVIKRILLATWVQLLHTTKRKSNLSMPSISSYLRKLIRSIYLLTTELNFWRKKMNLKTIGFLLWRPKLMNNNHLSIQNWQN